MIELVERYFAFGLKTHVRGLPKGLTYRIYITHGGIVSSRSCTGPKGSIRYYGFQNYDQAQRHAVAWAKRKIAEHRRAK